jgi:hypothetical protein
MGLECCRCATRVQNRCATFRNGPVIVSIPLSSSKSGHTGINARNYGALDLLYGTWCYEGLPSHLLPTWSSGWDSPIHSTFLVIDVSTSGLISPNTATDMIKPNVFIDTAKRDSPSCVTCNAVKRCHNMYSAYPR